MSYAAKQSVLGPFTRTVSKQCAALRDAKGNYICVANMGTGPDGRPSPNAEKPAFGDSHDWDKDRDKVNHNCLLTLHSYPDGDHVFIRAPYIHNNFLYG